MKVFPEMCSAHYIKYLHFYCYKTKIFSSIFLLQSVAGCIFSIF